MRLKWVQFALLFLLSAACGNNDLRMRSDDYFNEGQLQPSCGQMDDECDTPAGSQQSTAKNCSQVAANIAVKAAQVATAANEAQSSAAEYAAKEVRIQLAGKAQQASRAAQAVLAGKQALLDRILRELNDGEESVTQLSSSLEQSVANANKAECAAKAVEAHFGRLSDIVQLVGSSLADVDALSELALNDLNEKKQMLVAAKERSDRIQKQITCAREEYQKVKVAAYQAACAAVQAKQKAANTAERSSNCNKNNGKCNTQLQRARGKRLHQQKQFLGTF